MKSTKNWICQTLDPITELEDLKTIHKPGRSSSPSVPGAQSRQPSRPYDMESCDSAGVSVGLQRNPDDKIRTFHLEVPIWPPLPIPSLSQNLSATESNITQAHKKLPPYQPKNPVNWPVYLIPLMPIFATWMLSKLCVLTCDLKQYPRHRSSVSFAFSESRW